MAIQNSGGWTDDVLIREIRAGGNRRNKAWEYIYKAWRGYYLAPLLRKGATAEQVDDAMAQVMIDVEKQILKPDFELHSTSLSVYFTECLKRACSKRLAAEADTTIPFDQEIHQPGSRNSVEQDYLDREMLDQVLSRLGQKCKTVLLLFGKGFAMREIAEQMNFENEQTAKNLKADCLKKLISLTQNQPLS